MKLKNWHVVAALALTATASGIAGCVSGCGADYSDGERAGVITKFSRKGLFIKSWEGQMNLGGLITKTDDNGNDYTTANVWEFTARDPAIIEQVQQALDAGKPARLRYRQWLVHPWSMDSDYEVVGVAAP